MGDVSLVSLFARLFVSLAVVLALMIVAGKLLRGRTAGGIARRGRIAPIEVLARQGLGRSSSLALVRAGERVLVLGVTDTQVNLLAEGADLAVIEDDGLGAERTALPGDGMDRSRWTWKTMLDTAREKTVRRS